MPIDDFVRHVSDVLTRAGSLFGSASSDAPAADSAQRLSDAADTLRRTAAPDMAGSTVAGYSVFAERQASALGRLADADTVLNGVLEDAASAENSAAAASRSTVDAAAAQSERLAPGADIPARQRALVAALHSELGRQQELVSRHHQQAAELAEQARLLSY